MTSSTQLPMFPPGDLPAELIHVRSTLHKGEWRYSIVDFVRVLTETTNPERYWSDLKRKLARETPDYEIFVPVLMEDSIGRPAQLDAATREQLFRIVQSMPSTKVSGNRVERIKLWLASVGARAIEDEIDPERAIARFEGKISRRAFMEAIRVKLNPPQNTYGIATNDVYRGVFHRDAKALRQQLKTQSPRDKMDTIGLSYLRIAETICARHIGSAQELTIRQAREIWMRVADLIGFQVDAVERQLGIDAVTGAALLGPIDAIRGTDDE